MSFNRRWLLSTSGAAFLASISGGLRAEEKVNSPPPRPKPPKLGDAEKDLNDGFFKGYGAKAKLTKADRKALTDHLHDVYIGRLKKRHPDMKDDAYGLLWAFAVALGNLTRQVRDHEGDPTCRTEDLTKAKGVTPQHIDRARELLGFVLNRSVNDPNKPSCYPVTDELTTRETNEPCPLCQMIPDPPKAPPANKPG